MQSPHTTRSKVSQEPRVGEVPAQAQPQQLSGRNNCRKNIDITSWGYTTLDTRREQIYNVW